MPLALPPTPTADPVERGIATGRWNYHKDTVATQHVRARAPLDAAAVSAGIATMKLHLESGVVADSGAAVCLSAIVLEKSGFRSASVGTDVRVYGYLIAR